MNIIAINMASFLTAVGAGYLMLSFTVSHYRQYRRYFENRLAHGFKQNFIRQNVSRVFFLTMVCLITLVVMGWVTVGFWGAGLGLIVTLVAPFSILKLMERKRRKQFVLQLPDSLHALSASLRSGSNMTRGLQQLADWQPAPLSQEISLVLAEYEFGTSLDDALSSLHQRVPCQEVELMNTAILLSKNVGGNVSDTLETLATTLTEKLAMEAKIESLTTTGRLQGWVAMAIPILVGFLIHSTQPEKMQFFYSDSRGLIVSGIIVMMMVMAFFCIKRIVKVDI